MSFNFNNLSKRTKIIIGAVVGVLVVAGVVGGSIAIANAVKKNKQAKCEHIYDEGQITVEATCETDGVKTLKALSFTGVGAFTLTVSNGRTEKSCVVAFDGGRANVAIGLKGEIFSLKFVLEKGARVQKTEALLVKLDGVK